MDQSPQITSITVQHICITVNKPFAEVRLKLESILRRIDFPAFMKMISDGKSEAAIRHYVKELEGPTGLMIFDFVDHGNLLSLSGSKAQAIQYIIGNPLYALQMTEKDIRA